MATNFWFICGSYITLQIFVFVILEAYYNSISLQESLLGLNSEVNLKFLIDTNYFYIFALKLVTLYIAVRLLSKVLKNLWSY